VSLFTFDSSYFRHKFLKWPGTSLFWTILTDTKGMPPPRGVFLD